MWGDLICTITSNNTATDGVGEKAAIKRPQFLHGHQVFAVAEKPLGKQVCATSSLLMSALRFAMEASQSWRINVAVCRYATCDERKPIALVCGHSQTSPCKYDPLRVHWWLVS